MCKSVGPNGLLTGLTGARMPFQSVSSILDSVRFPSPPQTLSCAPPLSPAFLSCLVSSHLDLALLQVTLNRQCRGTTQHLAHQEPLAPGTSTRCQHYFIWVPGESWFVAERTQERKLKHCRQEGVNRGSETRWCQLSLVSTLVS